jgi:hypothetical protein
MYVRSFKSTKLLYMQRDEDGWEQTIWAEMLIKPQWGAVWEFYIFSNLETLDV